MQGRNFERWLCDEIPQDKKEISATEVTRTHPYLRSIADEIPPLDEVAKIQLLIGRDAPELINLVWAFKNMMAWRAIMLYLTYINGSNIIGPEACIRMDNIRPGLSRSLRQTQPCPSKEN